MQNKIQEFFVGPILGSEVRCLASGSGRPVILVSGWLGTAENFVPLMEIFPEGYRCYAVDLPGFGKSTRMNFPHTIKNYADFLEEFIKRMKLDHPLLVGISLGASIILARSLVWGHTKDKAILQSPAYKGFEVDLKAKIQIWLLIHLKFLTAVILRYSEYPLFQRVVAFFGDKNVKSVNYEYLSAYGLKCLCATDVGALIESLEDILRFDISDVVKKAKGNFLLVFGSEENLFPESYQRDLCHSLPNCKLKIMEGATHYAMLQRPKEFVELVNDFARS